MCAGGVEVCVCIAMGVHWGVEVGGCIAMGVRWGCQGVCAMVCAGGFEVGGCIAMGVLHWVLPLLSMSLSGLCCIC